MALKFVTDWYNGVEKNKDVLLENKMWEQTFEQSTFYNYYIGKYSRENKTTIQCFDDDKLIAVLIFCHFVYDDAIMKMRIKRKDMLFSSLGEVQLYVKPEYRKAGIATKLVEKLDEELYDHIKYTHKENVVYVLQATQRAVAVASGNMYNFPVYDLFGYFPKSLKDAIRYNYVFNNHKIKTLGEWKHWKRLDKIA